MTAEQLDRMTLDEQRAWARGRWGFAAVEDNPSGTTVLRVHGDEYHSWRFSDCVAQAEAAERGSSHA